MPALPPVPNVIRADISYNVGTDPLALTRLHFSYSGGPPVAADCTALANDVASSWNAHLRALQGTASEQTTVRVIDLSSNTGADQTIVNNAVGTKAGGFISAGTALLVNHKIARHYRGGKPRSYLPIGVTTDLASPTGWASASVTAFQTGWNAFIAAINGATSGSTVITGFVNVSYFHAKAMRTTPVVDAITSSVVNSEPASQRRRNRH